MAFELFEKKSGVEKLGDNQISVGKTSIGFGSGYRRILSSGYVEIYLDRENNLVGFKPTTKSITSYRVQFDKGSIDRSYITSSKVASFLNKGRYDGKIDEHGFIVIGVKEIANPKNKTQIPKE